jgi:hypothetical protein
MGRSHGLTPLKRARARARPRNTRFPERSSSHAGIGRGAAHGSARRPWRSPASFHPRDSPGAACRPGGTGLGHRARMQIEMVPPAGAGDPVRRTIDAVTTLGGSQADGICVQGLPPAALRLEPRPAGLVVVAAVTGLRMGGRTVALGARRLLRAGERATLRGFRFGLASPPPEAPTRVRAGALLRETAEGLAPAAGPHLVIITGSEAGERVALRGEVVIGRGRGAGLRVRDPAASRRHARIRLGSAGTTLEDLGAKNRLRLNGIPIERRPIHVRPGDRITVGETELVYEQGGASGGEPAALPTRHARRRRGRPWPARALVASALLGASAALLAAVSSCGP